MSFTAFQRSLRLGAALGRLRKGTPMSRTALEAGFASESGFREAFERLFGVTPGDAAAGGAERGCLAAAWLETPLGPMLAMSSERGLTLLEFVDRRSIETQIEAVRARTKLAVVPVRTPVLEQTERELAEYFAGTRRTFSIPLDPQGTPFERAVWDRLLAIPYGKVSSYAAIAREVGSPGASRAIGRANGCNRIAIVIPCHRVIRSDGALCGYGGGVERKQWLLDHECEHAGGEEDGLFAAAQAESTGAGATRRPSAVAKTSA